MKELLLTALYPLTKPGTEKPIVLLFYGPTGVGKTETANFLSKIIGEQLFRKQFSMFHSDEFASYLFGGKHYQNSFAKELLERESNIILLDEFDKPNPVFHSAFYQLFDEGIFEDKNYSVTVDRAIVICTSNYLSEADVRSHLGNPVYSRFDAVIKFENLSTDSVIQIIYKEFELQYSKLTKYEKNLVDNAFLLKKLLAAAGSLKNVRQIKRVVRDAVSTILVKNLIES